MAEIKWVLWNFVDPNKWSSLVGPLRKKNDDFGDLLAVLLPGFLVEHQETPVGWLLDRK